MCIIMMALCLYAVGIREALPSRRVASSLILPTALAPCPAAPLIPAPHLVCHCSLQT